MLCCYHISLLILQGILSLPAITFHSQKHQRCGTSKSHFTLKNQAHFGYIAFHSRTLAISSITFHSFFDSQVAITFHSQKRQTHFKSHSLVKNSRLRMASQSLSPVEPGHRISLVNTARNFVFIAITLHIAFIMGIAFTLDRIDPNRISLRFY